MPKKPTKLGYFSLPKGTPKSFPQTFLYLDKDKKIRIGKTSGPEMPYHQFMRSLIRREITSTKEGESFVKKTKL